MAAAPMIAQCVGAASLAIWLYLLFARGMFWQMRADESLPNPQPVPARKVAIVVPARDEAPTIASAVRSLLQQNYPGQFHVWLVDDHSSDGTAEIARRAALEIDLSERLSVVSARALPAGWTGKLWALSEGVLSAPGDSDYYFFTDADIVHAPDHLSTLIGRAENGGFDLVSSMVKLRCESVAEKLLIPAFTFFFFKLYPPNWVRNQKRPTAAAAGGCILIRRGALLRIGGIESIRGRLIDDCALAQAVKPGGSIWLGLTAKAISMRSYGDWREIGRMISRSAFTQLQHSRTLLGMAILGMVVTYLAAPVLIGCGSLAAVLGGVAWLLMALAFLPTMRFYKLSTLWALTLPFVAAFYLGATIHSAIEYWRGRGGLWKGRMQDASPIR